MYTLISGLWQKITSLNHYNILIVGIEQSGKTSLFAALRSFNPDDPTAIPPCNPRYTKTIGLNSAKNHIDAGTVFQLWDLGGHKSLRSLWPHYYGECHAVIFVHDCSILSIHRINDSKAELHKLFQSDLLTGVPIAIVGVKHDLNPITSYQLSLTLDLRLPEPYTPHTAGGKPTGRYDIEAGTDQAMQTTSKVPTYESYRSQPEKRLDSPDFLASEELEDVEVQSSVFLTTTTRPALSQLSDIKKGSQTISPSPSYDNHPYNFFLVGLNEGYGVSDLVSWLLDTIPTTPRSDLILTG